MISFCIIICNTKSHNLEKQEKTNQHLLRVTTNRKRRLPSKVFVRCKTKVTPQAKIDELK